MAYTVTIQATNYCPVSSVVTYSPIYVSDYPAPDFTITPNNTICQNTQIQLTNTSQNVFEIVNGVCDSTIYSVWIIEPSTGWSIVSGSLGN